MMSLVSVHIRITGGRIIPLHPCGLKLHDRRVIHMVAPNKVRELLIYHCYNTWVKGLHTNGELVLSVLVPPTIGIALEQGDQASRLCVQSRVSCWEFRHFYSGYVAVDLFECLFCRVWLSVVDENEEDVGLLFLFGEIVSRGIDWVWGERGRLHCSEGHVCRVGSRL